MKERKSVKTLFFAWVFSILLSLGFQDISDRTLRLRTLANSDKVLIEGFARCDRRIAEEPCIYTLHSDSQTVVLLGDSTAGTLEQVLYQVSFESGLNLIVFSKGGCSFQFTISLNSSDGVCESVNVSATRYLIENKPKFVVISNYVMDTLGVTHSIGEAKEVSRYVDNVMLVGTPPKFPDGERFGKLGTMFSSFSEAPKFFSADSFSHGREIDAWYRNVAIQEEFEYVSLFDLICDEIICSRYESNEWLYYDSDHLSTAGSYLIKARVENFIASGGSGKQ